VPEPTMITSELFPSDSEINLYAIPRRLFVYLLWLPRNLDRLINLAWFILIDNDRIILYHIVYTYVLLSGSVRNRRVEIKNLYELHRHWSTILYKSVLIVKQSHAPSYISMWLSHMCIWLPTIKTGIIASRLISAQIT